MRNISLIYVILTLFFITASNAQDSSSSVQSERCATMEYNMGLMNRYPKMQSIAKMTSIIEKQRALKTAAPNEAIRIPVVVHVIHNGEPVGTGTNLTDAHVQSQIDVLNQDFRRIPGTRGFNDHPDGADTMIEFYLAKEDPDCNPSTGIDRLDYSETNTSWSMEEINSSLKPETIWDSTRYLNIWTLVFSSGIDLGFAQFPGGPESTDGVVIGYDVFGSEDFPGVEVLDPVYNLGRTTTHEVGHYFGLYHTFNGESCFGSGDFVDDTPQTNVENYGCPSEIPDSCPSDPGDDMIENYMDYSDDFCMNIFTNGQSEVMNGYLSDPEFRQSLTNSGVSDTPIPIGTVDASVSILKVANDDCTGMISPNIKLTNYGTQNLNSITLSYYINQGVRRQYVFSGNLSAGQSTIVLLPEQIVPSGYNLLYVKIDESSLDSRECNNDDVAEFISSTAYDETSQIAFTILTDDYSDETSWDFKDSSGTILYSGNYSGGQDNNQLYKEVFDVTSEECYTFTIYDSESDGICCRYGEGYYELRTGEGELIKTGGEFASTESTQISTIARAALFQNEKLRIVPNPTTFNFRIDLVDKDKLPSSYQIFNALGQYILGVNVSSSDDLIVNTENYGTGIYFLRVYGQGKTQVIPFIKK